MINIPKDYYLKIKNNELCADHGPNLVRNYGFLGKWVFKILKRLGFFSEYSLTKIFEIAKTQSIKEEKSLEKIKQEVTWIDYSSVRERQIHAIFRHIKPYIAPEIEEELNSQPSIPPPTQDLPLSFESSEIFYLTETQTATGIKEILKKLPPHIHHLEIRSAHNVDEYVDLIPSFITSLTLYEVTHLSSLEKLPRSLKTLEVNMHVDTPFCWQQEDYQDLPQLTALTIVADCFFRKSSTTIAPGYFDHLPKSIKHFAISTINRMFSSDYYLDHNLVFPEGIESLRIEGFLIKGRVFPDSKVNDYTIKVDMFPSTLKKLSLRIPGYHHNEVSRPKSQFVIGTKGWPQNLTELFIICGKRYLPLDVILCDLPATLIHLSILGTEIDNLAKLSESLTFPPYLKSLCIDITPDQTQKDPLSDSFVFKNLPDSLEILTLSNGDSDTLNSKRGWIALLNREKKAVFPRKEGAPPLRIQFMIKDRPWLSYYLTWEHLKKWGITPNSFIVNETFKYDQKGSLAVKAIESRFKFPPQTYIIQSPSQSPTVAQELKQESLTLKDSLFSIPVEVMCGTNLLRKWDTIGLARMMLSGTKDKYYQHYLAMEAELLGRPDHGLSLQQMANCFQKNHFLINNTPHHQTIFFNIPEDLNDDQIPLLLSIVKDVNTSLLKRFSSNCLLTILEYLENTISDEIYNTILAELLTRKDAVVPKKILNSKFSNAVFYLEADKTVYLRERCIPDEIQKFLKALPEGIRGLDIKVDGNVDDFIDFIPSTITSLILHELMESNFDTKKLPRQLQKLEITMRDEEYEKGKFSWIKQKFEDLPPNLTSLHIEGNLGENEILPNYYFESLPKSLEHLEFIYHSFEDEFYFMNHDCIFPENLKTLKLQGIVICNINDKDFVIKTSTFPPTLEKLFISLYKESSFIDEGNRWPKNLVDLSLYFYNSNKQIIPSILNSLPKTLTNLTILRTFLDAYKTKDFIYPPLLKTLTLDITQEKLNVNPWTNYPPNEHAKTFCLENLPKGLDTLTMVFAQFYMGSEHLEGMRRLQRGWYALCKRPKSEVFIRDEKAAPLRIQFMVRGGKPPQNVNWTLLRNWDITPDSFVPHYWDRM